MEWFYLLRVASLMLLVFDFVNTANGTTWCPPNGLVYGCRCVWTKNINDNGAGLTEILTTCRAGGGRLITFSSMGEIQDIIQQTGLYTPTVDVFVGATRVSGSPKPVYHWMNTSQETFFSRWRNITNSDRKNHTCLAVVDDDLKAIPCTSWIRYLCERDLTSPLPTPPHDTHGISIPLPSPGNTLPTPTSTTPGTTSPTPSLPAECTPTLTPTGYSSSSSGSKLTSLTSTLTPSVTLLSTGSGDGDTATRGVFTTLLLKVPPSPEEVLSVIENAEVGIMPASQVGEMVEALHKMVGELDHNSSSGINGVNIWNITSALVSLSDMSFCDGDTFNRYAGAMSQVVALLPPSSEQTGSDEPQQDTVKPNAILDAMEKVMFASNISSTSRQFDSFRLEIRALTDRKNMPLIESVMDRVHLAADVIADAEGRVISVVYEDLHRKVSRRSRKFKSLGLASKVISVAIQKKSNSKRSVVNAVDVIHFTLKHVEDNETSSGKLRRVCAFWNVSESAWSDTGCRLLHTNSSHTSCTCSHLTSFAVLVLYYDGNGLSDINERVLYILSAVGCALSILGLAMTLFSYVYLRMIHRERILIHTNLALSLMLAQIVFVSTGDAHQNPMMCKITAVLMHFLFLAAFTWMMLEGLSLYLSCLRAQYNFGDMRIKYLVIGWGIPVLIVILSVAVQFPHYGDGPGDSCWLSLSHGLIWAFMGPMLLIIIFNLIILGLVIKVFLTLKANSHKTEAARVRAGLRAMSMLLPLLGVTWLLSLLVPFSTVFHYLFVIGNSLQGLVIFFLHCLCNDEVRKFLAAKRSSLSAATTSSDLDLRRNQRRDRSVMEQSFDDVRPRSIDRRQAWT